MLWLLWVSLRWDDMVVKVFLGGGIIWIEIFEMEIIIIEIIKRRDVGFYGIWFEYCIRKIICFIGVLEILKEIFIF